MDSDSSLKEIFRLLKNHESWDEAHSLFWKDATELENPRRLRCWLTHYGDWVSQRKLVNFQVSYAVCLHWALHLLFFGFCQFLYFSFEHQEKFLSREKHYCFMLDLWVHWAYFKKKKSEIGWHKVTMFFIAGPIIFIQYLLTIMGLLCHWETEFTRKIRTIPLINKIINQKYIFLLNSNNANFSFIVKF